MSELKFMSSKANIVWKNRAKKAASILGAFAFFAAVSTDFEESSEVSPEKKRRKISNYLEHHDCKPAKRVEVPYCPQEP